MGSRRQPARTPGQNKRLWGLVSQLRTAGASRGDAEQVLRSITAEVSGQERTSLLTRPQADEVARRLAAHVQLCTRDQPTPTTAETSSSREPWGTRGPGPRHGQVITQRMQEVLQALFHQAGMVSRPQQMGFARRQCKVPWPQTQEHYDQLMEPLKAMVLRATAPVDAWSRVRALLDQPGLTRWEADFAADLHRQFSQANAAGTLRKVLTPHKLLKLTEIECKVGLGSAA